MRRVLLTLVFGLLFGTCLLIYNTVAETRVDGVLIVGDADTIDGIEGGALVQTSRTVTAGTGMTGGGALDADVTVTLDATGDWTGTLDGLEGADIITNITVVSSNALNLIRITDNEYILHTESNAVVATLQDIRAHVNLGGASQTISDSSSEVITFSNEVYDVGGGWDAAAHVYNVPVNGLYGIYVQVLWDGNLSAGAGYLLILQTNNAQAISQMSIRAEGTGNQSASLYVEADLTTAHDVEILANSGGTSDNINGVNRLSYIVIRLLRED